MSESDVHSRPDQRCGLAWCTTPHGRMVHPDDEAHRSEGVGFLARVRGVRETGPGTEVDVEVGLLRRADDRESWLVLEAADGTGLQLSLEGARLLRGVLEGDPQIRAALAS